jgi:flavin reductase (DIM6/NTAB) family NADH-FMN oxidoreductase RutF/rubredoxin
MSEISGSNDKNTVNPFALHKISYGLYVLSTLDGEKPVGCVINTCFQITSAPPRLAVSCNKDNYTHQALEKSGKFGISVLCEDTPASVIGTFGYKSARDIDKYQNINWSKGAQLGVPLLQDSVAAVFECRIVDTLEVGTHTIFIGEVAASEILDTPSKEMTYRYYHEVLRGAAPKNAPTYIAKTESEPKTAKEAVEKETENVSEKSQNDSKESSGGAVWVCGTCGYEYDEATESVPFEELPEDWECPVCGVGKEEFSRK